MKSLDASVLTELAATGKKPVLLFTLFLTGLTLRYCTYMTNITFPNGGNVHTAKAIAFNGVSQSAEGQIGRISIDFDNVSKDMAAYADTYDFDGRMLWIQQVYLDADNLAPAAADEYVERFYGKMEQPSNTDQSWLSVTATEGKPLGKKVLLRTYGRECDLPFGGTDCNTDGLADLTSLTASGTADSGSTTTLVDNALTQDDDYWNYGAITVVKDSVTYNRKVKDFVAATDTITFDIALPVAVDNTTTYTVYKGCSKTWDACQGNQAWGPSADNKLNFGGEIHIGLWRDK